MLSIPKYPQQYAQHFPTIFYLLYCASQHHVMDCVYLVNWDAWMPRIRDCMPVVVQRPGEGEDEEGGDDVEEEEDDEIVLVGGGDSKKRSTPSKKKPSSEDSGDEVDDPPKRPAKKAKDSTPLNMFHAKVGQAKGKKAPPKKK